ncbi:MAG TPA: hypothetical protein ENJ87_05115 [Gammaproteobacteria bacterium]|nr:hypothetical protein [Gammaproteobacteria bacterium]
MSVKGKYPYLSIFLLFFSSYSVASEWLANIGVGLSYSDNYALQNGNYDNIAEGDTNRTGTELAGALSWQSLETEGGYSVDLSATVDEATDSNNTISNFSLSASRLQAVSKQWMARFSGALTQHRNDEFTSNSFTAASLSATAGYFSEDRQGLDLTLNWIIEDHDQNPRSLYKTQRIGTSAVYYLPYEPGETRYSASFAMQKHYSDDARRDAFSLLSSLEMNQLAWRDNVFRFSLNWRRDEYDEAYSSSTGTSPLQAHGNPGGGGPSGPSPGDTGNVTSTTKPRTDRQLYLSAVYQYRISRQFRFFISANGGRYMSVVGNQNFYNLFAGVRWYTR